MDEEMLKKLIHAWRTAKEISDGMENTFGMALDALYDVHGNILDALREYAFETGDIDNSEILRMLKSDMFPDEIASLIIFRHNRELADKLSGAFQPVKQPAPKFFTDEQIERMQQVFGGYVHDAK